jgi:AraC-like DNA-binding protein/mannose-6-phosphate isomerase-like protein (cupin superfamily)
LQNVIFEAMNSIPVHQLQHKTDQGFLLKPFTENDISHQQSEQAGAHRDDHYIFFLMLKGSGSAMVDFEQKTVRAGQLYYILPEQIHYRIKTVKARGWYLAVDPSLVNAECRAVFESWSGFQEPVALTNHDLADLDKLLTLAHGRVTRSAPGTSQWKVLHALLQSFFEMAAGAVHVSSGTDTSGSRPAELSIQFKKLLAENFRQYKSPAHYARLLHVSETYLNESVKKTTGSPVSFWIKYRMVTEAKRLLYFSNLNVKQVAHDLGFENHSYFSRFFSKETGMTALGFRKKFKEGNRG